MYIAHTSRASLLSTYLNTLPTNTLRYIHYMLWNEVSEIDTSAKYAEWFIQDTTVVSPLTTALSLCCSDIRTAYDLEKNMMHLHWNTEEQIKTAQNILAEVYQVVN